MKKFVDPIIQVELLGIEDVITTSGNDDNWYEGGEDGRT